MSLNRDIMKISVNNEKDLKRFYKHIFIYKSLIFRFVKFEIDDDKYNIKPVINALNIKNKKQRICYIYDIACRQVEDFYKNKNICEFKDNQCLAQRIAKSSNQNGCCRICEYRIGGSCKTHNLACKLFYCDCVRQNHKILTFDDLVILKCLNKRQRFMLKSDYFSLEKDVIKDLYYGIIIGTIRVSYRFLRIFVKK